MRNTLISAFVVLASTAAFAGEHHVTGHGATDAAALADATAKANAMCEAEHHGDTAHITKKDVHNDGADHAVDVTFDCEHH